MSHGDYVALAYAVAGIVIAWDLLAPQLRLRQVRRQILLRAKREAQRKTP